MCKDTREEENLQNETGSSTVKCRKEAFCCLTRLTFMHNSIPALFNVMAHVSVYASEVFFPKVNMLSPAYFHCHDAQVTLPLYHIY